MSLNRHTVIDKTLLLAARLMGKPFFRTSVEGPSFQEHFDAMTVEAEAAPEPGYYPAVAAGLDGEQKAGYRILHWSGPSAPTLLYNQGGAETPFDKTAWRMYPKEARPGYNVIAVQAACQGSVKELNTAFASLSTYTAMLVFAVKLNQWLIDSDLVRSSPAIAVSGYSLGGFVTNRHHMMYDSADVYVPFVAGTRHGDIFLTTIQSGAPARAAPHAVRSRLNFYDAWMERQHTNVFPVMGRYDQLNRLEVQGPSYGDMPLTVWDGGHLYGVIHPGMIRDEIESRLNAALKAKTLPLIATLLHTRQG